ncbi:MAG: hypothetical protein LUE63_04320, partial [Lachnospiraceae bacterium]|nr:hypothetical protein [Lachnospiraceae bacterium]
PLVLGLILSSLLELNFRRAWTASRSNLGTFFAQIFSSPLSLILLVITILIFASQLGLIRKLKALIQRKAKAE